MRASLKSVSWRSRDGGSPVDCTFITVFRLIVVVEFSKPAAPRACKVGDGCTARGKNELGE